MDGPVIELGIGRVTFEVARVEIPTGQIGRIGLLDEDGALICLGPAPAHVPAAIIAKTLIAPDHPAPETEVLGTGVVSFEGIGKCIDFVWMRPDEGTGTGGLDPSALERVRERRVRLDLRLIAASCGCGGTDQPRNTTAETARP